MVQNSSALREPSMDEILTSIREIIEENTIPTDHFFSEEDVAVNTSKDHSDASEGIYEAPPSVDDAMKALADRLGLPSGNQDFSRTQVQNNLKTEDKTVGEDNTVSIDMQKMNFTSEEKSPLRETKKCDNEAFKSQPKSAASDPLGLSAYCISSAEKIAEDVLRPAITEWLQRQLPVLLEKILREEIVKTVRKLP